MESDVIKKTEDAIKKIVDEGLTTNNLDTLYKLSKIKHMAKEDESMNNYGNYGRYEAYGRRYAPYGERNEYGENYGRRGYDMKYRGEGHIDRMYGEYERYEEGKEQYNRGNYGAKEDTMKSLEYMLKSAEEFFRYLREDAKSPEEQEMIRQSLQRMAQM